MTEKYKVKMRRLFCAGKIRKTFYFLTNFQPEIFCESRKCWEYKKYIENGRHVLHNKYQWRQRYLQNRQTTIKIVCKFFSKLNLFFEIGKPIFNFFIPHSCFCWWFWNFFFPNSLIIIFNFIWYWERNSVFNFPQLYE